MKSRLAQLEQDMKNTKKHQPLYNQDSENFVMDD